MKTHQTIAGNTYCVSSPNGGTVTDASGSLNKPVEAGDQVHVTAPSGELYCDDDAATIVKANFKSAALALGLLGGGNNGLPAGYTRVEFLESTGSQYVDLPEVQTGEDFGIDYTFLNTSGQNWALCLQTGGTVHYRIDVRSFATGALGVSWGNYSNSIWPNLGEGSESCRVVANYKNDKRLLIAGLQTHEWTLKTPNTVKNGFYLFAMTGYTAEGVRHKDSNVRQKIKHFAASKGQADVAHLVPALDNTGTPCMFDLVTRKPFYNSGTGDFIYPGKETTATTYSLRRPRMYAQMTPHGIRRLYHVPRGYNGTPEEYAEQNGFKLLVETPQPEEGYWAPVWHEREDCIELEWVETEPPAEELLTEA